MVFVQRLIVIVCALVCAVSAQAQTRSPVSGNESRLALVIGNGNYKDSPLANPVNDANAMAKALEGLGFKVILYTNATRSQMRQAMRRFGDELQASRGVGLFYFAGHGVQVNARNYLIPVGTDIQRDYEVEDEAIDAGSVLSLMQAAKARVNIVILDACRNNPYTRSFRNSINGLAPMQAPAGTLVAYSTAPGEVASDGTGENGLYTLHLLKNMAVSRLRIEDVFKNVRIAVQQDTGGKQIPWENTSLTGDFYFNVNVTVNVQASPASPAGPGLSRADVESAVAAVLAKQQQDEVARRQTQQLEIERAVQAALRKREEQAATAQAANQVQELKAAKAAVERLQQELTELRAARETQQPIKSLQRPGAPVPTAVNPTAPFKPALPASPTAQDPQQVALAAPATFMARPPPAFKVGQPVERPDVAIGDKWRYQVTDLYTGLKHEVVMEVQSVTENRIYTQSGRAATASAADSLQGGTVQVWDRNWNLLREGITEYSSPSPGLQFPLMTGKKWESEVNYPYQGGDWNQQNRGHIIGWEKVSLLAGSFDVVKIEVDGYWRLRHSDFARVGYGYFSEISYYSPVTNQIVKRELRRNTVKSGNNTGQLSVDLLERWELIDHASMLSR